MAQSAGEWLKGTWQRSMCSTMDVWERSADYSGQIKFPTWNFTSRRVATVLPSKSTPMTEMARTHPENAQRQHHQSGTEMDTTLKNEVRKAKDDIATDSNGRAERERAVMGWGDRILWQNIVVALCPTGDEEDKWSDLTFNLAPLDAVNYKYLCCSLRLVLTVRKHSLDY